LIATNVRPITVAIAPDLTAVWDLAQLTYPTRARIDEKQKAAEGRS